MAGLSGAGASFKLGNSTETPAGGVLTEIATWLEDIASDASTDELDATTFSPGATAPIKSIIFGATERTFTLTGRWVPAAETFFNAVNGMSNRTYEYGPEGTTAGKTKISGTVNVGAWSGPQQSVGGVIAFTITMKTNTRVVGVMP
jgi:hypothetical protein